MLGRSAALSADMWSCLAGFVEPGEIIEDAVRRETREEAGIECGRVEYFDAQPWPFPTSLMIGAHVEALSRSDRGRSRTELEDARWFGRDEVASMLIRKHPQGITLSSPVSQSPSRRAHWVEME